MNLADGAASIGGTWRPRVAERVNDLQVKVVRIEGEFIWHNHPTTDEAFLCLDGELTIDLRDHPSEAVTLGPGDFFVVPQGVFHRPRAGAETRVAIFEPAGIVNTGEEGGVLTAEVDVPLDY